MATPARAVSSTAAPKRRWGQAVKGVKNGLEGVLDAAMRMILMRRSDDDEEGE